MVFKNAEAPPLEVTLTWQTRSPNSLQEALESPERGPALLDCLLQLPHGRINVMQVGRRVNLSPVGENSAVDGCLGAR